MLISEAVKLIRHSLNISFTDAQESLGISLSYLKRIEGSENLTISLPLLRKYSNLFNMELSSIFFFAEKLGEIKDNGSCNYNVWPQIDEQIIANLALLQNASLTKWETLCL